MGTELTQTGVRRLVDAMVSGGSVELGTRVNLTAGGLRTLADALDATDTVDVIMPGRVACRFTDHVLGKLDELRSMGQVTA